MSNSTTTSNHPTIPHISSFQPARRCWVVASFSLRAGAHVPWYAPLPCPPCRNAKLAGGPA